MEINDTSRKIREENSRGEGHVSWEDKNGEWRSGDSIEDHSGDVHLEDFWPDESFQEVPPIEEEATRQQFDDQDNDISQGSTPYSNVETNGEGWSRVQDFRHDHDRSRYEFTIPEALEYERSVFGPRQYHNFKSSEIVPERPEKVGPTSIQRDERPLPPQRTPEAEVALEPPEQSAKDSEDSRELQSSPQTRRDKLEDVPEGNRNDGMNDIEKPAQTDWWRGDHRNTIYEKGDSSRQDNLWNLKLPVARPEKLPSPSFTSGRFEVQSGRLRIGAAEAEGLAVAAKIGLEALGWVPGPVGMFASAALAGIHLWEGEPGEAAWAALGAVPVLGLAGKVLRASKSSRIPRIAAGEIKSIVSYRKGVIQLSKRPDLSGNTALALYDDAGNVFLQVFGKGQDKTRRIIWDGQLGGINRNELLGTASKPGTANFGNKMEELVRLRVEKATGQTFMRKHPNASGFDLIASGAQIGKIVPTTKATPIPNELLSKSAPRQVWVNTYRRADGVVVKGHFRSRS